MAKTTHSSTGAKAQKGKPSVKAPDAKADKSRAAATKGRSVKSTTKAPTKTAHAAAKPTKKAAAKPVAVKKPVAKKVVAKPVAKPVSKKTSAASKPQPKKASPAKKPAVKKVVVKKAVAKPNKISAKKGPAPKAVVKPSAVKKPAEKKVAVKPVAKKTTTPVKHTAKPAAKPVSKPAQPIKAAPAKPAAKPAPVQAAPKSTSPAPATNLFKGKVASATAMVTPRSAPAAARHASSNAHQKNSPSSMNKLATKKLDNGITREDGRYALPSTSTINLPKGYHPSSNEEYMNPQHLAYFRNKLRDWRDQLVEESRQTMDNLRDEVRDVGDEAERATRETENSLELRTRDRYRKLISKIDKALRRIEEGSYGFCEETDEEIGVERLDARPIATLSLDAQERREHLQKQMGD
jgi:DnaK suppressor protein